MLETRHQFHESLREVEQQTLGGLDMVLAGSWTGRSSQS